MKKIILELDILDQLRLKKAESATGKSIDDLVVKAIENFLSGEGFNNPNVQASVSAA